MNLTGKLADPLKKNNKKYMKTDIAATKTNLIKTKKTLSLTEEGYELLDEKRKILLSELAAIVDSVDNSQKMVDSALAQGYNLVDKSVVEIGKRRLEEISFSIDIKNDISISQRRILGVSIPIINLRMKEILLITALTM